MIDENLRNLFTEPKDDDQLRNQVRALRQMVISLCQEVAAIRTVLASSGNLDREKFSATRKQIMLEDHSSAGPSPWTSYSYYPFAISETAYLRETLRLSEEEIQKFCGEVDAIQTLT